MGSKIVTGPAGAVRFPEGMATPNQRLTQSAGSRP